MKIGPDGYDVSGFVSAVVHAAESLYEILRRRDETEQQIADPATVSPPAPQRRPWPEDLTLDELLANEPTETQARLAGGLRWSDLTNEIHTEQREATG